jgi:hypothetical protein
MVCCGATSSASTVLPRPDQSAIPVGVCYNVVNRTTTAPASASPKAKPYRHLGDGAGRRLVPCQANLLDPHCGQPECVPDLVPGKCDEPGGTAHGCPHHRNGLKSGPSSQISSNSSPRVLRRGDSSSQDEPGTSCSQQVHQHSRRRAARSDALDTHADINVAHGIYAQTATSDADADAPVETATGEIPDDEWRGRYGRDVARDAICAAATGQVTDGMSGASGHPTGKDAKVADGVSGNSDRATGKRGKIADGMSRGASCSAGEGRKEGSPRLDGEAPKTGWVDFHPIWRWWWIGRSQTVDIGAEWAWT